MASAMFKSLTLSLGATLGFELAGAWLLGVREKRDYLLLILVNVLTNPILVLILNGIWLKFGIWPAWYVMGPLEVGVVLVEGFLFRGRLEYKKINPFVLSAALNGISVLGGMLL